MTFVRIHKDSSEIQSVEDWLLLVQPEKRIAQYAKLNPDDFSKFSRESMRYVEKHY